MVGGQYAGVRCQESVVRGLGLAPSSKTLCVSASLREISNAEEISRGGAEAQRVLGLPAAGVGVRGLGSVVSELESGGPNWESTTLAPACAARPKASVDIPSWRLAKAGDSFATQPLVLV